MDEAVDAGAGVGVWVEPAFESSFLVAGEAMFVGTALAATTAASLAAIAAAVLAADTRGAGLAV